MKRSRINEAIEQLLAVCTYHKIYLPRSIAMMLPDRWGVNPDLLFRCRQAGLGFDVTDFGSGQFDETGLTLFTLSNEQTQSGGYCEKVMLARTNQRTPLHTHRRKTETITNIGGDPLTVRLWHENSKGTVLVDHCTVFFHNWQEITLRNGASIVLEPGTYHEFWSCDTLLDDASRAGYTLLREVSDYNNDHSDNVFKPELSRFAEIEEDVFPLHLLCN